MSTRHGPLWLITVALVLALSGCTGDTGATGPQGDPGTPGADGDPCVFTDNGNGTYTIACGDTTYTQDVTYRGTVGGLVVDAETREPLAGASVTLVTGGEQRGAVVTTEDGLFSFADVPAGEVLVAVAAPDGYGDAWVRDELTLGAGGAPGAGSTLTLGPVGLVPRTASLTVRILDEGGAPVGQYPVTLEHHLEWVDYRGDLPTARGSVLLDAVTDGGGYATFTGLPDLAALSPALDDAATLTLPPRDLLGDGVYEFPGGEVELALRSLGVPALDVVLRTEYPTTLSVVSSNVPQLAGAGAAGAVPGIIATDGVVEVTFNQPILPSVGVAVADELGDPIGLVPAVTVTGAHLAIDFGAAPLTAGREYNLVLHAVAAVGVARPVGDFAAAFFTPASSAAVTVAKIARDGANRVDLEFSEPIGTGQPVSLSGETGCVTFFNANLADVNRTNYVGDAPGELGNPSCNGYTLYSNEPDPVGPVGASGYTRFWYFIAPLDITTTFPATQVHLFFSHVSVGAYVMKRTDGTRVADFTGATVIGIP
jgi:hypothetical protein